MSVPGFSILWQDAEVVAIHKPAGLLVHRSSIARGETQFALQMTRDVLGSHVFPVHRLDKPTSGVLLFARSSDCARILGQQFASGQVEKTYLAIVRGIPHSPETFITHPLREELDRHADSNADWNKEAQAAETRVCLVAACELPVFVDRYPTSRYSLVRAYPKTGRKHQVRRHLRHMHHPIIGDVNHGCGKHNRFFVERFGVRRLFLACEELGFCHPATGQRVRVRAPLAEDFARVVDALGWGANV